jgi:hypothetical protein
VRSVKFVFSIDDYKKSEKMSACSGVDLERAQSPDPQKRGWIKISRNTAIGAWAGALATTIAATSLCKSFAETDEQCRVANAVHIFAGGLAFFSVFFAIAGCLVTKSCQSTQKPLFTGVVVQPVEDASKRRQFGRKIYGEDDSLPPPFLSTIEEERVYRPTTMSSSISTFNQPKKTRLSIFKRESWI